MWNDTVAVMNAAMLESFPGTAVELLIVNSAADSAAVDDTITQDIPSVELLQSFEPPSLPQSKLHLSAAIANCCAWFNIFFRHAYR